MKKIILLIFFILPMALIWGGNIHTSYLWHMHQPIYWPDASQDHPGYQVAYESIQRREEQGGHPIDTLEDYFSKDDRQAVYQWRVKDAINNIQHLPQAGAQVTYSGSLLKNVESLGANNAYGYSSNWKNHYIDAMENTSSSGFPRLDMVIIPFHHPLAPLVDESILDKEIAIYKLAFEETFGKPASKGFFPPEFSFSQRIIPTLARHDIDWVFVPNTHISRACEDFPLVLGTGGENCVPPNKADIRNPGGLDYFRLTISRGCSPANAYPLAYTPQKARYVDPETGQVDTITVVPAAMAMSWVDGYQPYGPDDIDSIAHGNDSERPMLVVLAHDGDNAFGGGYSYYMESVPSFTSAADSRGYIPTTVAEYLSNYPVPEDALVHVEDGSWPNADGDFGDPRFINWNWPLIDQYGNVDPVNGWHSDQRNWAVITAALNYTQTAEDQVSSVSLQQIYKPGQDAADAELAWHHMLSATSSCYNYYGTAHDHEVKPTLGANLAYRHALEVIDNHEDTTAPTIFIPQRYPYNPGSIDFGSVEGYQQVQQPSDFYVWTYVFDVSGVEEVNLKIRTSLDNTNPLDCIQNETYAGGDRVSDWISIPMNRRSMPAHNIYNDPHIDYFIMPDVIDESTGQRLIADHYWAKVEGYEDVLIDYYVEAQDVHGNIRRSPIQHVWVGSYDGPGPDPEGHVSWSPENPQTGEQLTLQYTLEGSPLSGSASIYLHHGFNSWSSVIEPDPAMTISQGIAEYTFTIPPNVNQVDFVFHNGHDQWDNNHGQDWAISVQDTSDPDEGFNMDGQLEDGVHSITSNGYHLWYLYRNNYLYLATEPATEGDVFIFAAEKVYDNLHNAPWAKNGMVAQIDGGYMAAESENEYITWSGLASGTRIAQDKSNGVLEGTLHLPSAFEENPGSIYVAVGRYQTHDGGTLTTQIPQGSTGDGNIYASDFHEIILQTRIENWHLYE